jgi:perosamine synthetase
MTNITKTHLPFARPLIGEEETKAVNEVLKGHVFTHGPNCTAFEEAFAKYIGAKHAITLSSCTAGLHLALMAHDIGPGDEVIVPAMTHVATAHVVEHVGATPVFVDVEQETGNIDPACLKRALSKKTKAILVVHYLGLPCEMEAIQKVAGKDIPIIEDCAVALGATYKSKSPGTLGIAGCFSFYPSKHITTMEGGMLATNDDAFAKRVRQQRAFGYDKNLGERSEPGIYDIAMLGHNFRMSEAQAAMGICQLSKLDDFLAIRKRNTEILLSYAHQLNSIVTFPTATDHSESSYYCLNITLRPDFPFKRKDIVAVFTAAGIGTSVHYPIALPLSTYYQQKYGYEAKDFPVAQWIATNTISLPCGPHLSESDVHRIGDVMLAAFAQFDQRKWGTNA